MRLLTLGAALLIACILVAQERPAGPPNQAELSELVEKQFGPMFKLAPFVPRGIAGRADASAAPVAVLLGDFDGDGIEDAAIVVRAKGDLLEPQAQYSYKVVDPYDAYFGYGDPKITREFSSRDPERDRSLVVVHSWRSATPKAKFVVINLPFDRLWTQPGTLKKKPRTVVIAEEAGLMQSMLYWDGKKYKYEPGVSESQQ
jgi:hypothetical protein